MKRAKMILAAVLALGICGAVLCGCGSNMKGEFYSVKEAFEAGYLTKSDLKSIAGYYNNRENCPDALDKEVKDAIIRTACEEARLGISEAEVRPEDFEISAYYGNYNNCYAVKIKSEYIGYPEVVVDEWEEIGGVKFHHTSPVSIDIWKVL